MRRGNCRQIYLSPDAEETLTDIPTKGMIICIGGLVDRPEQPGASLAHARAAGHHCAAWTGSVFLG